MTIYDRTLTLAEFQALSPEQRDCYLVAMHGASNRWTAEALENLAVQNPLLWWERFGYVQRIMLMAARNLRDTQDEMERHIGGPRQ